MQGKALLSAIIVLASACSPVVTGQRTLEPAASVAPTRSAAPNVTVAPSPSITTAPSPTPVARTISGRATLQATGAGVAGVKVRGMPSPINDGRIPGPDVTAVTDERGAYTFSVLIWSPEALANSSSFQMMVQVTPPPGLLVLSLTKQFGGSPGVGSGLLSGPLILIDLDGSIDITLGPGHVVEGRITSGTTGTALAGVGVAALGTDSMLIYGGQGDAFAIAATSSTDANGRYTLTVPSGTYVIHTAGPQGAQPRFWSDDPAVFQASRLAVGRNIAGIDMALVPVTRIGGYVRSGSSFGDGVEGARVAAYLAGGIPCCRLVGMSMSGYNGTFVMHVPPGTYRLVFDPPTGSPYAAQWLRAAAGFATATDVVIASEPLEIVVELARR